MTREQQKCCGTKISPRNGDTICVRTADGVVGRGVSHLNRGAQSLSSSHLWELDNGMLSEIPWGYDTVLPIVPAAEQFWPGCVWQQQIACLEGKREDKD